MKKLLNKKGFTLMEMLIVVAIIVILVAIAIPTFSSSLDDAKAATDAANMRGAKGVAEVADMSQNGWKDLLSTNYQEDIVIYYDIESGSFKTGTPTAGYGQSAAHKGDYIVVELVDGVMKDGYPMWKNEVTSTNP